MIDFHKMKLAQKPEYDNIFFAAEPRGCEYSFANLFLWGRKRIAEQDGFLLMESQFDRKDVYIFPIGEGDLKAALDTIIDDADARGICCCLAVLTQIQFLLRSG